MKAQLAGASLALALLTLAASSVMAQQYAGPDPAAAGYGPGAYGAGPQYGGPPPGYGPAAGYLPPGGPAGPYGYGGGPEAMGVAYRQPEAPPVGPLPPEAAFQPLPEEFVPTVFEEAFVPGETIWGGVEFLGWWRRGGFLPAMATTSPPGTATETAGGVPIAAALGQPGTTILFGNNYQSEGLKGGLRFSLNGWLDDAREVGLGGRYWAMDQDSVFFATGDDNGDGMPTLGRPFFNVNIGLEDALLLSFFGPENPGDPNLPLTSGSIQVSYKNRVHGGDVFLRVNWYRDPEYTLDALYGYMYTNISDVLVSSSVFTDISGGVNNGTRFDMFDRFTTSNEYHAGLVGLTGERRWGRFSLRTLVRVGMGNMRQRVNITGQNTVTPLMGVGVTTPGGFHAQPTNIGNYVRDRFVFAPELGLDAIYQVTDSVDVTLGYSFLYWTGVATAGSQINRNLNPNQLSGGGLGGGPAQPDFTFGEDGYWLMGFNAGVNVRY